MSWRRGGRGAARENGGRSGWDETQEPRWIRAVWCTRNVDFVPRCARCTSNLHSTHSTHAYRTTSPSPLHPEAQYVVSWRCRHAHAVRMEASKSVCVALQLSAAPILPTSANTSA